MKMELVIFCVLMAAVKAVPMRDSDTELLFDERYGGVPDHINGMALERDGDFNKVSRSMHSLANTMPYVLLIYKS